MKKEKSNQPRLAGWTVDVEGGIVINRMSGLAMSFPRARHVGKFLIAVADANKKRRRKLEGEG